MSGITRKNQVSLHAKPQGTHGRKTAVAPKALHFECLEDRVVPAVNFTAGPLAVPANRADITFINTSGQFFQQTSTSINPTDPGNIALTTNNDAEVTTNATGSFIADTFPDLPGTNNVQTSTTFDAAGRLFWSNLLINPAGNVDIDIQVVQLDPTNGSAIGPTVNVNVASGDPNNTAADQDDSPKLAADSNAASPFANNLYVVWTKGNSGTTTIYFSRSTNQGITWSTPLAISGAGEGFVLPPHVAVAANGDVYVAYHSQPTFDANSAPDGVSGQVFVRRSTDGGVTFGPATNAFGMGEADITFNVQAAMRLIPNTQVWTRGSAQPWILPDPVRPGNVYVIASDDPTNAAGGADVADIVVATSNDNGATWMQATLPDGSAGSNQLFPSASIDRFGNIVVSWYDDRAGNMNANNHTIFDVFATYSTDGGMTWATPFQINDQGFDSDYFGAIQVSPTLNATYDPTNPTHTSQMGAYFGIDVFGGTAYVTWGGNTGPVGIPTGNQMILDAFSIAGSLAITGDDAGVTNDNIVIRRIAGNTDFFEVLVNNQRQYAGLFSSIDRITIDTMGGNDNVTFDLRNGDIIPVNGIDYIGGTSSDTITVFGSTTAANNFILTDAMLTAGGFGNITFSMMDVESANLTGGNSTDRFDTSGWTGAGSLDGLLSTDTLTDTNNVDYILSDTLLQRSGLGNFVLSGIEIANLTGGAADNSFTVSGWTGSGTMDGQGHVNGDTIIATNDRNFILSDTALSRIGLPTLDLVAIEIANLTGGPSDNNFIVSNWTGTGTLDGQGGTDALIATSDSDFTLSNSALTRTAPWDTLMLVPGSFEVANLTGGPSNNMFLVTDWAGTGTLNGEAGDDTFTFTPAGNLDPISGRLTIIGGEGTMDHFILNDQANTRNDGFVITPTAVDSDANTTRAFAGATYDDGIDMLTLNAGTGINAFRAVPSLTATYNINGNLPVPGTVNGDFLGVDFTTAGGRVLTETGPGNGNWTFGSGHQTVNFTSIERLNGMGAVAVASEGGRDSNSLVRVLDDEGQLQLQFFAYDETFAGGVRVATGDVNGDMTEDIVTVPGRGGPPLVRVFDGVTGGLLDEFFAFSPEYIWGSNIAVGDVNGDLLDDIVVSVDRTASTVASFTNDGAGTDFSLQRSFEAFEAGFIGGVYVATGDVNGDGSDDIVVGSGSGRQPTVRVFDAAAGTLLNEFHPYADSFRGGVRVAAGDATGNLLDEVVTVQGPRGESIVGVFNGATGAEVNRFPAFPDVTPYAGVHVSSSGSLDGSNSIDAVTAQDADGRSMQVRRYASLDGRLVDITLAGEDFFQSGYYPG